ncbi:putative glycosidase CRH2 [Entomophthora muscae]|uniref:Glycosidase CRH2 n=1 Tax=Entomophthora muscae TaxID=34485 RepID=A0ACC2T8E6_9FUNG|nr:putative glycosidase CRH2 [Entomophthora muscae]
MDGNHQAQMKLRGVVLLGVALAQQQCQNNKCGQEAPCCSQFGYCGTTWEFCAAGCNPNNSFMPSSCYSVSPASSKPPNPKPQMDTYPISWPASSGGSSQVSYPAHNPISWPPAPNAPASGSGSGHQCSASSRCPMDTPCCSEFGFCGNGINYCNVGCNPQGSFSPLACSGTSGFPNPNVYPPPSFPPLMPPIAPVIYPMQPSTQMNPPLSSQMPSQSPPHMRPPQCSAFKTEFERGVDQDGFVVGGPVAMDRNTLSLRMIRGTSMNENGIVAGVGGFAKSRNAYGYGKYSARIRSARIGGVVSAFNLISRDGDEIDFEFVGRDENAVQSNYYYKGILDYTKGQFSNLNSNTHQTSHVYSIVYTPDHITFVVDGHTIRIVTRASTYDASTNRYLFPTSPVQIQFQVWDGGAGSQGTREWAGGYINWKDPELTNNGGFIDMQVDWVAFECL